MTAGATSCDEERSTERLDAGEIYREYAASVSRWAHRLGGPLIDLEDAVHDVFVKVYEHLPRLRGGRELKTWLFRATQTAVRNRRRKQRLARWLKGSSDEAAGDAAAPGPSPLTSMEQNQRLRLLYGALDGLKDKYREALILSAIEGLDGEEVAELLGIQKDQVWVRVHRARAMLVAQLGPLPGEVV